MEYIAALIAENRRLGDVIGHADQTLAVPTCPGWSIQQLFRHVGRGDRWAAQIVTERADGPVDPRSVPDGKPPADPDGAGDWFHGGVQLLIDAVAETGPDTPVWTFVGPRPAAWWIRRRLHEATVHRSDAELALGLDFDLSPELSADAISEWLDILAGEPAGRRQPALDTSNTLHLHAFDESLGSAGEWFIRRDTESLVWDHSHAKAVAAVRGRSVDLLLALTRRRHADDVDVEILGDPLVWDTWLERTQF